MDERQLCRQALKLIDEAKELSRERFLVFAENMYGTPRNTLEHLWKTSIVSDYNIFDCFPEELTSLLEDYVPNFWDVFLHGKNGKSGQLKETEAVFLPIEKVIAEASEAMKEEYGNERYEPKYEEFLRKYNEKVKDGSIPQGNFAAIVYDEEYFIATHLHNIQKAPQAKIPRTQEQVNEDFKNYVSKIFTHERIHLNTRVIIPDPSEENPNGVDYVYGVRLQNKSESIEQSNSDFYVNKLFAFEDHDEEVVDVVAQLIETYSPGNTIEDGLYQIITNPDESLHRVIDSKLVLSLFTLFPDELTKWTMFEAQNPVHHNLFLEKHDKVFGENMTTKSKKIEINYDAPFFMTEKYILNSAGTYFNNTLVTTLEPSQVKKRKEMLETLGVENITLETPKTPELSVEDTVVAIRNISFSDTAMEELSGAIQDIRTTKHEFAPKKPKEKNNNIEP